MRIYVGGLSFTSNSAGLIALFTQVGAVTDVNVIEDRDTGQSKGFAFVEMPDASEAKAAIAKFDGYSHDGRSLKVNEAKPREDRNGSGGGGRSNSSGGGGARW
jgi:cold-inducible RNA-binding protein